MLYRRPEPVIRPEDRLLLYAAHGDVSVLARTTPPQFASLDWNYLLRTAGTQGMLPLLWVFLRGRSFDDIPQEVRQHVEERYASNARRNFVLAAALLEIVDLLTKQNVDALAYKGPTLAVLAYGDLAMREFGDLDLLVREDQVRRVCKTLETAGYERLLPALAGRERAFLRYHCEHVFSHPSARIPVEMHWRLAPRYLVHGFHAADFGRRRQSISLLGMPVDTFKLEDLLVVLCVHGAKEQWRRLGWICDVGRLIDAHQRLDWQEVFTTAKRSGCERMLAVGLLLARDLAGAGIPDAVMSSVGDDPQVARMAARVQARLFERPGPRSPWGEYLFQLNARERPRDRLRGALDLVLTPTITEWTLLPLPRYAGFVHYIARPLRLACSLGRSAVANRSSE